MPPKKRKMPVKAAAKAKPKFGSPAWQQKYGTGKKKKPKGK